MASREKLELGGNATRRRIAVAMSGGVDSLKAASLLKEQGHDVFGLHMRLSPRGPHSPSSIEDPAERLSRLAAWLDLPVITVDFSSAFEALVIQPFVDAYRSGLTPNPCVRCNPEVKFGLLMKEALRHGADSFATGHYARVSPPDGNGDRFRLERAADRAKDQSYFLYRLTREQLSRVVFPLGDRRKRDVQAWAKEAGLAEDIVEDSQEICFIPSGGYREFMAIRLAEEPLPPAGPILDMDGNRLGEHRGIHAYTVGQRRGLGLPSSAPYYVVAIEPQHNAIRVGRNADLFCSRFLVAETHWSSIPIPENPVPCLVRIRNQHEPARALVEPLSPSKALVTLETPQRAVTPGQAAVFYEGDTLLGGGTIQPKDAELTP